MRGLRMGACAAAALAFAAGPEAGASGAEVVIGVPADYPTIQAALDAAPRSADVVIRVAEGTYAENLTVAHFGCLRLEGTDAVVAAPDGAPAVSVRESDRVVISGFTLSAKGVELDVRAWATVDVRDVRFAPCQAGAVWLEGGPWGRHTVEHGGVVDTFIGVPTPRLSMTDCTIDSPRDDGVHALGARLDVEHVEILSPGGDGIDARDSAVRATVRNTVVRDAGGAGIALEGPFAVVEACIVLGPGGDGIVTRGGFDPVVADNWVSYAAGDGIVVGGVRALIDRNHVFRVGGDGLRVTASRSRIADNVVSFSGKDGLDLSWCSQTLVRGNVVADSGGSGFRLDAAQGNRLARNVARRSAEHDLTTNTWRNRIAKSNRFQKRHGPRRRR
jgi:hypothetical protein